MSIRALIARLFRTGHVEADLKDELQCHLDMEIDEYIRRGMDSPRASQKSRALIEAHDTVCLFHTIPFGVVIQHQMPLK